MKFWEYMKPKGVFNSDELGELCILEENINPHNFGENLSSILGIICGDRLEEKDLTLILSNQKRIMEFPLNDYRMNRRGLHIFRVIFSHLAFQFNSPFKEESEYTKIGLVIRENFLKDPEQVSGIISEFEKVTGSVNKQPWNISLANGYKYPNSYKVVKDSELQDIILDTINRVCDPEAIKLYEENTFLQNVLNEPGNNDHQKLIHSDIFYPAIKFWYFPQEVKLEHGPFCYAKGSTVLSEKLLDFYYTQVLNICDDKVEDWKGKDHIEGSFRISESELSALGFEMTPMVVPGNTLVVGNVFGFHSRGNATVKNMRPAIHGSIRWSVPFC